MIFRGLGADGRSSASNAGEEWLKLEGARLRLGSLGLAIGLAAVASGAWGQAAPTAVAGVQFSVFGGVNGTYTGVGLGRDLGITAGGDATFRQFLGFNPAIEVRGTFTVDKGSVDGQKNLLAGLVLEKHLGRIQPYGDILVGGGEIDFVTPYPNPDDTVLYVQTASTVISPGVGANLFVSDHWAFKADFQFQHYSSPVTTSGSVYSKAFTLGLTYRLPFGGLGRGRR